MAAELTIGEFSRISRLSVKTLRHYLAGRWNRHRGRAIAAGDASVPTSLRLANGLGRRAFLTRIGPSGQTTRILTFGDALPMAIDRTGTHMLYLLGHSPPALWEPTIAGGGLTDRHRLLPDSSLGPAAY